MIQAEPKLNEAIAFLKHGSQSIWLAIPCPGSYSFTMT